MHGMMKMIKKNGYMKLEETEQWGINNIYSYVLYCIYKRCAVCDIRYSIIIEDAKAIVCTLSSVSLFALSGNWKEIPVQVAGVTSMRECAVLC